MADFSHIGRFYEKWCRTHFPLPTESEIDAFQDRLEAKVPSEYREFLLQYNGGVFTKPVLSPGGQCPNITIEYLNGIHATYDFAEVGYNLFENNQPAQIVLIGGTPGNDLLFMEVFPDDQYGSIGLRTARQETFHVSDSFLEMFDFVKDL